MDKHLTQIQMDIFLESVSDHYNLDNSEIRQFGTFGNLVPFV